MKIEIELNGETYTWKSDFEDHDIYDITEKFRGLLVSAGFHPESADQVFDDAVIGSWSLSSENDMYADELQDEYDLLENETNITSESLK